MPKMSDTHVASVAEQATDAACIVTVIDVKTHRASQSRTDGTLAFLFLKHCVVLAYFKSVAIFKAVIASAVFVFCAPVARVLFGFIQIFFAPSFVHQVQARAAALIESVCRLGRSRKVACWLRLLAVRAPLHPVLRSPDPWARSVGSLPQDHARLAVKVEPVSLGFILVKLGGWLHTLTIWTKFIGHGRLRCETPSIA